MFFSRFTSLVILRMLAPPAAAAVGALGSYMLLGASPLVALMAAAGLAIGLLVTTLLTRYGDRRIRSAADVKERLSLETIASVERFQARRGTAIPAEDSPALTAYGELARWLRSDQGSFGQTFIVTSAGAEEGKSTTAANLALALAEDGEHVVLVDGDLRWSSLRSTSEGPASLGLTGLLLGYIHNPYSALVKTDHERLQLLPAGVLPKKPEELLVRPRLGDVFASMRRWGCYVVVDSPPVLEADDAALLASQADATLLVVREGKSRAGRVKKALQRLEERGITPVGAVLNLARAKTTALQQTELQPDIALPVQPAVLPNAEAATPAAPAVREAAAMTATLGEAPSAEPQPYSLDAFRRREMRTVKLPVRAARSVAPGMTLSNGRDAAPRSYEPAANGGSAPHAPPGPPAPSNKAQKHDAVAASHEEQAVNDVLVNLEQTLNVIRNLRKEREATARDEM